MKAVIPVAGAGTRLRPHTYTQPKPLIPVAGKAIISFIIDQLRAVGVKDFVFVIGYLGEKIRMFVEKEYPDLSKTFVVQKDREGLGHAIWTARGAIRGESEIIIMLGDTVLDVDLGEIMRHPGSVLGIKSVEDPREFGVVEMNEDYRVRRVVEKPRIPRSNMAMVGIYKIREVDLLLHCLEQNIERNVRTLGEFQLTDALMAMIEQGAEMRALPVNNWFDCGKKEILLETNSMLLEKQGYASMNLPPYKDTIIIHPVAIGEGCQIAHSIIGPYVTIGNHASIQYSIVKDSIIGNYASIAEVVLKQSLVGSDAAIKGLSQSLNIGDNTEIDFS